MRNKTLKILFASVFVLMASFAFNSKGNFTNEQTSLTGNDNVSLVNENKQLLNNIRKEETTETKTLRYLKISSARRNYKAEDLTSNNEYYSYLVGETFDPTEYKAYIIYSDHSTSEYFSGDKLVWNIDTNTPLTNDVTKITCAYEENGFSVSNSIKIKMIESFNNAIVEQALDDALQQFAVVRDDSKGYSSDGIPDIYNKILYAEQLLSLYSLEERKNEVVSAYIERLGMLFNQHVMLFNWINDFRSDNATYKGQGGLCGVLKDKTNGIILNGYLTSYPELGLVDEEDACFTYGSLAIMDIAYDTTGEDGSIITVGQTFRYLANAYKLMKDEEVTSNEIALATSNVMSPAMQTVVFVGALILVSLVGFVAIDSAKSKKKGNK